MRSISTVIYFILILCAACCSSFSFEGRQRNHSLKTLSCPTRQRRRSVVALSSSLAGDGTNNNIPEQQIIRQKRMSNGYRVLTVTYTTMAAFQNFFQQQLPSSSFVLAAGITWILSKAAHRNKLANDTHKRLNIVICIYSIINVLQSCRRNSLTIVLVSVMTWILYKTALPTSPQPEEEIRTGIKKNNKFLFKNCNKNSILLSIYRILACGVIQSHCGGWDILLAIFTTLHCFRGYVFGVKGWILQDKTIFLLQNDLKQSWKQTPTNDDEIFGKEHSILILLAYHYSIKYAVVAAIGCIHRDTGCHTFLFVVQTLVNDGYILNTESRCRSRKFDGEYLHFIQLFIIVCIWDDYD